MNMYIMYVYIETSLLKHRVLKQRWFLSRVLARSFVLKLHGLLPFEEVSCGTVALRGRDSFHPALCLRVEERAGVEGSPACGQKKVEPPEGEAWLRPEEQPCQALG